MKSRVELFALIRRDAPRSQTQPATECDQTDASFSYGTGNSKCRLGVGRPYGSHPSLAGATWVSKPDSRHRVSRASRPKFYRLLGSSRIFPRTP